MNNEKNNRCPECGAALPTDAPEALCSACLLRQAMASRTIVGGDQAEPPLPPPSPGEIAGKFPQFELVECLGRGGMGVVYKARQTSLDRWVAIKILAPECEQDERFAERFRREAKTLARMNHPNIVTVFDHGETDGLFYIVMEYVDGVNLRDLLHEGKMEPEQALAIVPPVCEALDYAHGKGVVHRDIKPENVLLDRDGNVKIADFGIASLVGATGEKSGTPPYMAPEQQKGTVDRRADIYALGVVLYEMLTGERPTGSLVAPSRKVEVDVKIDEMVLRALEVEPERRYQTAGEFRTVVETISGGANPPAASEAPPLPPATPPAGQKPRGMFRRWWWIFLVMIPGGLILGLMGGVFYGHFAPQKYEARAIVQVTQAVPSPGGFHSMSTSTFFATQFEVITAKKTLAMVSSDLGLARRWMLSEQELVERLRDAISTNHIKGTDLIEVRVRHTNPNDAAAVANSVVEAYSRRIGTLAGDPGLRVIIHEQAKVPRTAVTPNVVLVVVAAGVAGLLLSPLMALLLIAVLHKVFPGKRRDANRSRTAVIAGGIILTICVLGLA